MTLQKTDAMHCAPLFPVRILGRKWSYLVLRALREPLRFSQLQSQLKYPTNRVLARELTQLVAEGLVLHENEQYSLTVSGKALCEAIQPLAAWSVRHHGIPECPSGQPCSSCANYAQTVGVRSNMRFGTKL